MGDVYQATDTKLGRSVAIKFLPETFSHDTERVARFQREACVLASLNHSNIAAIHGLEEIDSRHFLVMELVSGETLADRVKRGAVPIEEALPIAKQIAEALEEAHDKGIIHRDLKPANIKLTPDSKVKVLDFGLAKAYERDEASPSVSNSPTISMAATNAGLILGTAAYMSPEQARGRALDKRTDIWALGCVLYEMLTGTPAFGGDDVAEILASVVKSEPDWNALAADTPAPIRKLLRRCLEKDRKRRLHDAADARIEIEEAQSGLTEDIHPTPATAKRRERLAWTTAIVGVLTGAVSLALLLSNRAMPERQVVQFSFGENAVLANFDLAVSPNGKFVAYSALNNSKQMIWVRPLDSLEAKPIPGTEDGIQPFWSPDSRSIGFFAQGKLKRVDLGSSRAQALADASLTFGGSWNYDGVILFKQATGSGLQRISASGGAFSTVRPLQTKEVRIEWPSFLPDGRHFLFSVVGVEPGGGGVFVGSTDSTETKTDSRCSIQGAVF
jgi:eukaryotic-like serine/threonine-protein kinase